MDSVQASNIVSIIIPFIVFAFWAVVIVVVIRSYTSLKREVKELRKEVDELKGKM